MGYMRDHAIIVSSWDTDRFPEVHAKAIEILSDLVSPIIPGRINGHVSFFVAPDGSKEGWETSTTADAQREAFIAWCLLQTYSDGSPRFNWVEVQFADDENETKIVRDSDHAD